MNIHALADEIKAAGLPQFTVYDESNYLDLCHESVFVWIQARPAYCNRGRWQVVAESQERSKITIDFADGFPRYYFHADCLVKELYAWFEARDLL